LIERADDAKFVKSTLLEAAKTLRRGGQSMVPVYLDQLNTYATRIEKSKVKSFVSALFEVHDEIDLEIDAEKGFGGMANTSLRFHWLIRRLTRRRFSLQERTACYLAALESSALGWTVNFVSSARDDYEDDSNDGATREEDCLVQKSALGALTERALEAIRAAAANGSLMRHKDLVYILYRWREFLDGDSTEIRAWTDARILEDDSLVVFAHQFTGRTWSMGMGGFGSLGDRVSKSKITAQMSDDTAIIDAKAFRGALERLLAAGTLNKESAATVQTLLDAWDRKRAGKDGPLDD
jgi:predicted KAP-like P-loop ATPase